MLVIESWCMGTVCGIEFRLFVRALWDVYVAAGSDSNMALGLVK